MSRRVLLRRGLLSLALLLPLLVLRAGDRPISPAVTLQTSADRVVLANGLVTATLAARSGDLLSFRLGERELLSEPAYLDWQDGKQRRLARARFALLSDPARTAGGDGRAEIAFTQTWSRDPNDTALDVELRYALLPGERALRLFVVFRHPADYPAAGFGQSRYVLRLRDDIFDTISVDDARTHPLPSASTPVEILGPKESMRFTAGPFRGAITDKYHYFTDAGGHFFHGWMGAETKLGLWIVYGSTEDANGGPTRQHNTAHWPRMLLKILSCGHYGAPGVKLNAGEAWEKIYGPWMLYANAADSLPALRADAARQAQAEQNAFPPAWLRHPAFPPAAARGVVTGRLILSDPQAPDRNSAGAWVGLAAPTPAPDWQRQSLGYQFWTRADAEGRFALRALRPGRYTLHAFVDGVLDEFHRADIEVDAGREISLGDLAWTPVRHGRQLWQIGVPDRRAAEFRHGENHRRWGLWLEYPKDFPADVDYVVGRSHPRTDWNFAQVTRPANEGPGHVGTRWRVRFAIPPPAASDSGEARLRFAFAGAHNTSLRVLLDDSVLGEKTGLGSDNAVARAGIHGQYSTWDLGFPARLLTPGEHTLVLEQRSGGSPFKNILYDCIRLEVP